MSTTTTAPPATGYMQWVNQGDTTSTLCTHIAKADGTAACGTVPTSPVKGPCWWYNNGTWVQMVPHPVPGPTDCLRCKNL